MDKGKYVGDAVYGALDGIVTTFAIVSGVAGAALSSNVIIILGLANLIADGVSMAAGNYLSTKAEKEYNHRDEQDLDEKDRVAKRLGYYGFTGPLLKSATALIMKNDRKSFLQSNDKNPFASGGVTFGAFVLLGGVPLLPFLLPIPHQYLWSVSMTFLTLFVVGALKVKITKTNWFRSGMEMLIVGGVAAGVAYGLGYVLSLLV